MCSFRDPSASIKTERKLVDSSDRSAASSLLDCSFSGSTCRWGNDHNNWPFNWNVRSGSITKRPTTFLATTEPTELHGAVCLDVQSHSDPAPPGSDITARLFGPLINFSQSPACLRIHYQIVNGTVLNSSTESFRSTSENPHKTAGSLTAPRLAVLRRQMG